MISRFACKEDIFTEAFVIINEELLGINNKYQLPDHGDLNRQRFSWWNLPPSQSSFYGSRFWEYPFAILASDLRQGMKCADVGCGTSPFTIYLAQKIGVKNITGIDPDFIDNDIEERHSAFGVRKRFLEKTEINYLPDYLNKISVENNYFDRVFCISVLEHIPSFEDQVAGLNEMARILKPGGRLILTVDVGINTILTHPLDLVCHSGLFPFDLIDFRWPKERFVNYGESSMDVFGLVLEKSIDLLHEDYFGQLKISRDELGKRYKSFYDHFLMSYNEALFIKEKRKNYWKSVIKLLLGRYD